VTKPMKPRQKIKVEFRELGEHPPTNSNSTDFGQADKATGEVTLDPRQPESEMLDSAVHEFLHVACPYMAEKNVAATATIVAEALWKMGYRRR
jgi:hypothetical protein